MDFNLNKIESLIREVINENFSKEHEIQKKKITIEFEINLNGSIDKVKQEITLAMSKDSIGLFKLGKDIEKFSGLTLKEAQKYKETPNDAYVYGLCNAMNGGEDIFFWTNGTRLSGAAKKSGALEAIVEQISHECVHLTRLILSKYIFKKDTEWYVKDLVISDKKGKNIVDEESFATAEGLIAEKIFPYFFEMAKQYIPQLKKINLNESKNLTGLRRWFKEKWVDISRKVKGKHPECGRSDADKGAYPKCRPQKKINSKTPKVASSFSKKEKQAMVKKKRAVEKEPRSGKTPHYTTYKESEEMDINETKLCAKGKAAAKAKFDVYPCVPLNSQALTKKGWRFKHELKVGDDILTYNINSDALEWNPILHIHYYENAPLINFGKSTGFKIKCTPNHKWVVQKRSTKGNEEFYHNSELIEAKDINKSSRIVCCAKLNTVEDIILENFSKTDSWVENVIKMSSIQRDTYLTSAIVYDGWDKGESSKIKDRHTFGFKQKNLDHNDACVLAAYLSGYHVNGKKEKFKDIHQSVFIRNKKYHATQNLVITEAENEDVWCPTTENNTWVMKQNGFITITGNSAYANGYAVKVCKGQVKGLDGKKEVASGYRKKKGKPRKKLKESFENLKLNLITGNIINESYQWTLKEATYKGKKVTLNRPFRQSAAGKKFAVYVKSASGNVKKIRFGAQGYRVRNANKAAASNFQKRHRCSEKNDKTKAGYWACRAHLYSSLKLSSSRTW